MNCDQTCERLPWLLNGTLDAGERQEVEEHLRACASCRKALAETRLAWQLFDEHIPSEQLVAYAWRDPGPERQRIEQHLATCPRCAAELELAGISRRLESAEDEKVPLLVPRLESAEDQKVPLLVPPERRPPAPARIWRSSALAASLVGLIAATGWIESSHRAASLSATLAARERRRATSATQPLRGAPAPSAAELRQAQERLADLTRRNEQLGREAAAQRENQAGIERQLGQLERALAAGGVRKQPEIVANGVTLSPQPVRGVQRGTPPGSAIQTVPRSAPFAVLILASGHLEGHLEGDAYELAIVDDAGQEIRRLRDLHPESDGQFVLSLRRGALAPGSYTLQLQGVTAGQRVALDSYAIRVD